MKGISYKQSYLLQIEAAPRIAALPHLELSEGNSSHPQIVTVRMCKLNKMGVATITSSAEHSDPRGQAASTITKKSQWS